VLSPRYKYAGAVHRHVAGPSFVDVSVATG
jgi:hypothetical protein